MKQTSEGIERGMFLLGPLVPNGKDLLFTVTRVHGKHSIEAIGHASPDLTVTINLSTQGIHREDSEWKRVTFEPFVGDRPQKSVKGFLVVAGSRSG